MRVNGKEILTPNPQTDGRKTLTLEEWEERGRPRTDFVTKVGRKRGVVYKVWEQEFFGSYHIREQRANLIDTRRVEYGR